MTLLKAIVRPDKVDSVKDALGQIGISGMTLFEVRGHGKQKGHPAIYRGQEYNVDLVPKVQFEVVVDDSKVSSTLETIVKASHTGQIGDGKIFVSTLDDVVRIRTGETGVDAL